MSQARKSPCVSGVVVQWGGANVVPTVQGGGSSRPERWSVKGKGFRGREGTHSGAGGP